MPYDYATERPNIFTENGFKELMIVRDFIDSMDKLAGAVSISKVISHVTQKVGACDSWNVLAYIDYLEETGYVSIVDRGITQHNIVIKV